MIDLKEFDDYQKYIRKFYPTDWKDCKPGLTAHALHGLSAEVGELHGVYQKRYQGHEFDEKHAKKELGDILWFVSEYADSIGWKLSDVARTNIEKLDARYPDGFEVEKSLHRKKGDV